MVRLYYLAVINRNEGKSKILCECTDLNDFAFFRRGGAKEFMRFSSCMLAGRTDPGSKVSVREQMYICHVFVKREDLAAAAVTDDEYPHTVAHICLMDLLSDFEDKMNLRSKNVQEEFLYDGPKAFMEKYKTAHRGRLSVLREELDETNIILHESIENILRRGENLDELVTKTDDLSLQAKTFYKTARKTNACCSAF